MSSPIAKRVRKEGKITASPVVVHADELDFKKHVFMNPVFINKQKGFKLVKVFTAVDNPNPLRVQFSNTAGRIPLKFGVDTNTHGKTNFTFAIPCEKEYDAMVKFQNEAIDYAKAHRSEWWNSAISDSQIVDNFTTFVSKRKEKTDGGFWPGNMKVSIPMNDSDELNGCVVVDEFDKPISIHELPGRKWDCVMIELNQVYFQNKYNWGFGPKTLRLVKLAQENTASVAADVDFLDIALSKCTERRVVNEEVKEEVKEEVSYVVNDCDVQEDKNITNIGVDVFAGNGDDIVEVNKKRKLSLSIDTTFGGAVV
jgi:hypothetical protein